MNRFYDTLAALAVILTPAAMMIAFGWSAYNAVLAKTGVGWLSIAAGIATAAAIEVVGMVAGETALWLNAQGDRHWTTAAAILVVYVAAGLFILRGSALMPLPVLAGSVYILVGLRARAAREQAGVTRHAAETAAWEREKWHVMQADRTRIKLATVEHHAGTEPALISIERAQAAHERAQAAHACEQCDRSFASVQALNAHRRFCTRITE